VWDAYVGAVMRIESPGGVFGVRPEGRAIYVVTAHNPGRQMASDTANSSVETRLAAELDRRELTWWLTAGRDPSWTHVEPGVAVIGVDEADAIALRAEFGQDAISCSLRPIAELSDVLAG
jgi:hypothetical protein